MQRLTNVPDVSKDREHMYTPILCEHVSGFNFHIYTMGNQGKITIGRIHATNEEYLAMSIAHVIEDAMRLGYNQRKREHLRFIGVKDD